jgi:hypothetical protein
MKNNKNKFICVSDNVFISLEQVTKLKKGDVFLWKSWNSNTYELHTFHSDVGYGIKTFTDYDELDDSSVIVNRAGVCGVLIVMQ